MKKLFVTGLMGLALATAAHAGKDNTGCGLGTVIFGEPEGTLTQSFVVTTNGTFGSQTFGITSGTSNCSKPASFVSSDKLNNFVKDNMDVIALEISQGEGESLDTLAELMSVKDKTSFKLAVSKNFDKIFTSEDIQSAQVIDNIATLLS